MSSAASAHARPAILIVDDNGANRVAMEALLSSLDLEIASVPSGEEALKRLLERDFAVVLMDVQMPGMDGLEATRRITARWPNGERPRIVAMTANAMQGDREECLAAGMDDYLTKPIRVERLVDALTLAHQRKAASP